MTVQHITIFAGTETVVAGMPVGAIGTMHDIRIIVHQEQVSERYKVIAVGDYTTIQPHWQYITTVRLGYYDTYWHVYRTE